MYKRHSPIVCCNIEIGEKQSLDRFKVYEDKEHCSGCTACMHSCPTNAISMIADSEGFMYPHIDDAVCTACCLCKIVCPFQGGYNTERNFEKPLVYAVKHRDDSIRMSSSSGGVFTAMSDYILNKNGFIYGVAFDDDFKVIHQKAETMIERDKFKGSKYVQSDLQRIFSDVKVALDNGSHVLFTGTPCQTAGLNAYLRNKNYQNLIMCDLVCHGVMSPLLWRDYIGFLEKKKKSTLQSINFRDKTNGWHNSRVRANFKNSLTLYSDPMVAIFNSLFYQHIALRPACHFCIFKNINRPSDITIADFWGIENIYPEFDDNKGVSLVLINTEKGESIFNNIEGNLLNVPSNINDCKQRALLRPDALPERRNIFWKEYYLHNFEFIAKKYTDYGFLNRLKHKFMKPILRKIGII